MPDQIQSKMRRLREQGVANTDYSAPTSNLSPEETDIRQKAQEFRQKYGTQDTNHEQGAKEQGFGETAEDFLTQGKDRLDPGTMTGSLPISRLELGGEEVAPKISRGLWQDAIRKPQLLKKMAEEGVPAAEQEFKAGQRAIREGAQDIRDLKDRIKPAGLGAQAKPFEGDYVSELNKANAEDLDSMRSQANDLSSAYKKPAAVAESNTITYSDPKSQRLALKRERMDLDMSNPADRKRMSDIDSQLSDLETSSIQSSK